MKIIIMLHVHINKSLKRFSFPLERWANGKWTLSERWVKGKRKLNERWVNASEQYLNAERKLVNDMSTLNDERMRTRNANEAQTQEQCERWTHDERTMNVLFGKSRVLFSLHILNLKFG